MSGHAPKPTQILASGKALEARGLITIPVLVDGVWHPLVATPSTWRGLSEQLVAIGIAPADTTPPLPPIPKSDKPRSAKEERYRQLYAIKRETRINVDALARREGINPWTLRGAFTRIGHQLRAEAAVSAARVPIEKPKGGIL